MATPPPIPVPIDPAIEIIDELVEVNDPPVQREGAENVVVAPAFIAEGEAVTDPAWQVEVTVTGVPDREQLVDPFAKVHDDPETVAVPSCTPVPVDPDTVRTDGLFDENVPPVQPEGAERAVVPPGIVTVEGVTITDPVGHITATVVEQVTVPLSQLIAKVVGPVRVAGVLLGAIPASPEKPLVHVQEETPVELQVTFVDVAYVGLGLAETVHPLLSDTVVDPLAVTPWYTEVIVEVPTPTPVTTPEEEVVATPVLLDDHVGPVVNVAVFDPSAL